MKLRNVAIFAACSVLVGSAFASGLKSSINKANRKICAAFTKNDGLKTFDSIARNALTSDFKHVDHGQSQGYDAMLAEMKGAMGTMHIRSAKSVVSHVRVHGSEGSASNTHEMRGTMSGPDKKTHRFRMWGTTHDKYRKEGGEWKMSEMNWASTNMTVDGKPFDMSKMGG